MKFNIGCGSRDFGEDWVHIDGGKYKHIDSQDIFIKDYNYDSAELIYASHFIEYFDRVEVIPLLKRWKDVLKPKGTLRLAVPNFKLYSKLYSENKISIDNVLGPLYGKMIMDGRNIYHKTTYDYSSLKKLLEKVGMKNIKKYNWEDTCHSKFDDHSQAYLPHMDKKNGILMSLNVECIK